MQLHCSIRFLCTIVLCFVAPSVVAQEVSLRHKGLTLNAELEFAAGKNFSDGVILMTHGGLAHRGMETIAYLQSLLKEQGYNTLAINLSLGIDNRQGMYDCQVPHRHRHHDAGGEISAWLNWLKQQGASQVALLGHSRGGAQTALYAADRDSTLVKALLLLAPATGDNGGAGYQQRYHQPLAPLLEKARTLIRQGKGDTLLESVNLMFCRGTEVSADAFISYYGPDLRLDTLYLLPKLRQPTLIVVAGDDEVVVSLEEKVAPMTDRQRLQMAVIDGADHLFRDLYADEAVEAIDAFLSSIGY